MTILDTTPLTAVSGGRRPGSVSPTDAVPRPSLSSEWSSSKTVDSKPTRVLILDDEPSVLQTLVQYLRGPALNLVTCSEIEAAQCLLDRERFDVLVSDLEVSDLGGLEGIRLIRHVTVNYPEMAVYVFSGKLTDKIRELGTALGVTELLEKPSGLARLRDLLVDARAVDRAASAVGVNGGEVTHVAKLDEVLESRGISAVLQPIVCPDLGAGSSVTFGFEGLARGPEGSLLRNPEFLLAYAAGKEKLFEVELQCIEAVLAEANHVSQIGKLFINVRPRSLSTPGFPELLSDLVSRYGFDRQDIVLELTEQQSILNLKAFDATLGTLRDHGFGLALDDFGSGFSNLHLVQTLPLDYLKIDGFFCCGIETDQRKQKILRSTFEMAKKLGISTIVERVETESELVVVMELGASYAQGYYFSRPLPGRDLQKSFEPASTTSVEEAGPISTVSQLAEVDSAREEEIAGLPLGDLRPTATSGKELEENRSPDSKRGSDSVRHVPPLAFREADGADPRDAAEQPLWAQNLESVGQLVGGAGHSINNLLTVVIGFAEIGLRQVPDGAPLHEELLEIRKAGEAAGELTQQLRSFGRQQNLAPKVLNLNDVVADFEVVLRRTIRSNVELKLDLASDLDVVKVDPARLRQVLVNLAVNASEAMEDGGRLAVKTRNIEVDGISARRAAISKPGPYVLLTVSDTGHGIDESAQTRVFEPFYTTKPRDQGAGLGLSAARTVVKESGGFISFDSEVGVGTSFKVHFPSAR